MKFRRFCPNNFLLGLSSSAFEGTQPPRQVVSVLVARFFTSSSSSGSAGSGSGFGHSSSRRIQQDEESRNVRVSVWWDFENCNLPAGANVYKVAQAITTAIRSSGIKGPIAITAFGDVLQLSRINQEALSSTGINLTHVPQGGKNSADRSLLIDLMCWVSQNPPPAHLFLISSDRDFASILHRLRMNNYNVLLASKAYAPGVLRSAATIMWDWCALVKGENVTGRHFNQPPDGPYNSWYGHYRAPLQDPCATIERPNGVKSEESPVSNSNLDSKVCPVPKEVVKQICMILSLYPRGISIVDLRAELIKSKVPIDRDFYGYKKFSRFLLSMPDILQVYPAGDGQFLVRGVVPKTPMHLDSSAGVSMPSDQRETDNPASSKLNTNVQVANVAVEARRDDTQGNLQQDMVESDESIKQEAQESQKSDQQPVRDAEQSVEGMGEHMRNNHPGPIVKNESSKEDGILKKIKRLWFGSSEAESVHHPENKYVSEDGLKCKPSTVKGKFADENIKSHSLEADTITQFPPSSVGSAGEVKANIEVCNDKSKSRGFFNQILKRFKFWGEDATATKLCDELRGSQELVSDSSQMNEIFTKDSFWRDIESFINSPKGFTIISHSKTRERMARNLQKEGPSCLKPLSGPNMLHLVDALITEKKWVEESTSETLPFRVTQLTEKSSRLGHSCPGLRSIFVDPLKSHSTEQSEERSQNVAHAGVSVATVVDRKPSERSTTEVFADCQKLVKMIIEENPGGYNLGCFRRDFLKEFGYHLDIQKLGYQKLQSLIQIMPGARIESGFIVPSNPAPDATSFGRSKKGDDSDSSFEELGPEKLAGKLPEYEPSLSEDEDSDSDTEASLKEQDKMNKKKKQDMKAEDKDSSLLQILDSWYSSEEGDDKKEKLDDSEGSKLARVPENFNRKQKPIKTYSFVTDSNDNNDKEKLINGILGSLKKSIETRIQG